MAVGCAVLELISDSGSGSHHVGVPANGDAVSGGIKVDSRSSEVGCSGTGCEGESLSSNGGSSGAAINQNVSSSDTDVGSAVLGEGSGSDGASSGKVVSVVEAIVVNSATSGEGLPSTVSVNLNVVAGDSSRAGSLLPRDGSGRSASRSGLYDIDGGSSGGGGGGVSDSLGPCTDTATDTDSRSTDSEADR